MHTRARLLCFAGLAGAVVLALPGCLERKETVRVDRNGRVEMRVEIEGDPGDFGPGDALPEKKFGWDVEENMLRDPDGKEKQHRAAKREFRAGQDLPDSYVDEDDPQYGVALEFPTSVTVEKRDDGTYYHFKRAYKPRSEARYAIYKELLKDRFDQLDKLAGKDPAELTEEERSTLVGMLRTTEALKRAEYVTVAAETMAEHWPQDYGLRLRQALIEHFESVDADRLLDMLGQPASPERDEAINDYGARLVEGSRDALLKTLKELRIRSQPMEEFLLAYDTEEARRAVTEDIGDERWEVRVELPGEIVAHNALSVDGQVLVWVFPGKALHDRAHVLMATSRVGRGDREGQRLQPAFSIPRDAERLFLAFRARIYRWAFGLCRSDADALDIVQEVFVRLLRSLPHFDDERSAVAWLRRTTVRTAVDQWRSATSRERARLRSAIGRPIRMTRITDDLESAEQAGTLRAAVERLSQQQQLVIVARTFDAMTFAEIAAELCVSIPTVKTHYLRALAALRERLGGQADERGNTTARADFERINTGGCALASLGEYKR